MKQISKRKTDKKISRKRNPELRELLIRLKKQDKLEIATLLARPRRKAVEVNVEKLNKETKENDVIVVPGKLLGKGNLDHKLTIAAFSCSQQAKEKLKNCKFLSIEEAIKNKDFKIIY